MRVEATNFLVSAIKFGSADQKIGNADQKIGSPTKSLFGCHNPHNRLEAPIKFSMSVSHKALLWLWIIEMFSENSLQI